MQLKLSLPNNNAVNSPLECLEKIKKLLDSQVDFNKGLADHAIKGNRQEVSEIFLSLYLDLSKAPAIQILPEGNTFAHIKRTLVNTIINDLSELQQLKNYAYDKPDLDKLYIKINCFLQESILGLKNMTTRDYKLLLSYFYEGKNFKIALKQTHQNASTNTAISADNNILKEMLTLLSPHVSPQCLKFTNSLRISFPNTQSIAAEIDDSGEKYFIKTILKWIGNNSELNSLILQYYSIEARLTPDQITNQFSENCLRLFGKMECQYLLQEEIERRIALLQSQSNHENTKKIVDNPIPKIITAQPMPIPLSAPPAPEPSKIIIIENEKNKDTEHPVTLKTIETETETENTSLSLLELQTTDSPLFDIENKNEEIHSEAKEELSDNQNTDHYRLFSKSNKDKNKQNKQCEQKTTVNNVLNLNKEHQNTLMKVFDLIKYDYINLRALVNLTQALGGTLKTTGANRCRIEIKNIYAQVLISEEKMIRNSGNQNVCNKATITMHGGGHRSTRSQNQDADKAPEYLIKQFRAAFTRAGYTPENLGLNPEQQTSQNPSI